MPNPDHNEPLLTIVTIAFNVRTELAETIASVAGVLTPSCEYIVVDGGSSDGSRAMLEAMPHVDRWVSEKDQGIYDAMNKGVTMASGEWICFMNAGDMFADPSIIADIEPLLSAREADIIYGDTSVRYADGSTRYWRGDHPARIAYGMICSHQAVFARRALLQRFPFTLGSSASDFEFMLRAWRGGARFRHIDRLVAIFSAGGVSDIRRVHSVQERWRIVRENGLANLRLAAAYGWALCRAGLSVGIKRVLPQSAIRMVRRLLHSAS